MWSIAKKYKMKVKFPIKYKVLMLLMNSWLDQGLKLGSLILMF